MPSFFEGTTIKPTAHRPTRPVTMRILEKVRHVELLKPAVEKPIHVFCEEEFPPCSGHDTTTSLKLSIPTRLFQIIYPWLQCQIRQSCFDKEERNNSTCRRLVRPKFFKTSLKNSTCQIFCHRFRLSYPSLCRKKKPIAPSFNKWKRARLPTLPFVL